MKKLLPFVLLALLLALGQPLSAAPSPEAAIPVGSGPWGVGANPATNRVYVANQDANTVSVIDGATDTVIDTVNVGSSPACVGVNPATNRIYVANYLGNSVSVIDGATNAVVKTIPVGSDPNGVAVNPATNRIYVANYNDNNVSVIDGATNTVVNTITVGAYPYFAEANPITNQIYVTNEGANSVSVIDGATDTVVAAIPVGASPHGLAVNPTTNRIWVANSSSDTISIIDGAANTVIDTAVAGDKPYDIDVIPATNRYYVTNENGNTVSVMDGAANAQIVAVAAGTEPDGIAANPATFKVYAANYGSDTVSVFRVAPGVWAVNSTGDEPDADPVDGLCLTSGALCTLRAAIEQSNASGAGGIIFAGMAGVPTIQPATELPPLSAPIAIDGATAGGRLVELDGSLAGSSSGLTLAGGGSTVKGLVINNFGQHGIVVLSSGNLIEGNRIGTDPAGVTAEPNTYVGVWIDGASVAAQDNTIRANLISGNGNYGVYIDGALASNNALEANYIGVDVTGSAFLSNNAQGVGIYDASYNRIGGASLSQRNIISANYSDGIWIAGSAAGNLVQGNLIGTDAWGQVGLPNVGVGILVEASDNTIGESGWKAPARGAGEGGPSCAPPCNLVSSNSDSGVRILGDYNTVQGNFVGTDIFGNAGLGNLAWGIAVVGSGNTIGGNYIASNWTGVAVVESSSTGNSIVGNRIWDNFSLGIDLGDDGVTANDLGAGDADTGENGLQNYPLLDWVVTGPPTGYTFISGEMDSAPSTSFGLEFFYSDAADPSGYGQGRHYLGWAAVSTDGTGWTSFAITLPATIPAASYVAATATDPAGNTSEFSAARVAVPEEFLVVGPSAGGMLIYTDTSVLSTTVDVPAGAVSETIVLGLQPMDAPTHPPLPGLRSGDETFDLSAYLDNDVLEGLAFLQPVTVTVRYTEADIIGIYEPGLRLYYWDGSTWQDAAGTCSPPSTYFLDTVENVMRVEICHLTEWNIQGPDSLPYKIRLPLALKGF